MKKYKKKYINLGQIELFEEINQKKINEIEVKKALIYIPWQVTLCNGFKYEENIKKNHYDNNRKSNTTI
jgi:hypothetical protein